MHQGERPPGVRVRASGCSGCGVFWVLLGLFTLVPLGEVALLLQVKDAMGFGPTVGLVFLTGVIGAALARWQGTRTLKRIHTELGTGQLPAMALFEGALIVLAGAVLLTPGIMTDCVGFSLLVPPVRRFLGRVLRNWAARRFGVPLPQPGAPGPDGVIDAEVVASRPADPPPPRPIEAELVGEDDVAGAKVVEARVIEDPPAD